MSSSPLITVLMPVFNAVRFLHESIGSILQQTYADWELVMIDDGSTDGSLEILREYERRDPRIRIHSRPNTGIVGALNDGLAMAKGAFIARMDSDDSCRSDRLARQLARMQKDSSLVALGSCAVATDPAGRRLGPAIVPSKHADIERQHLRGVSCIFHPAVMMPARALREVGGYRSLCPAEDYDLWLRLGEIGQLANLTAPLFTWRRTEDGLVAQKAQLRNEAVARALADAWIRRRLPGRPPQVSEPVKNRYDLYLQWAWQALQSGEFAAAWIHTLRLLACRPISRESWRLLICASIEVSRKKLARLGWRDRTLAQE